MTVVSAQVGDVVVSEATFYLPGPTTATPILTDPTSVVVAVARPDASVFGPPSVVHASTGVYTASITTDQPGRWKVTWTATGAVADVKSDVFEIAP